jgi:hypothetical protein
VNSTVALVLIMYKDAIFVNATFEDWQQVMGPKVKGAWHLHELFPNLDFFVSLSSMTGIIGRTGTSLYAGTSVCFYGQSFSGLVANISWRHSSTHSQNIDLS